MVNIYIYIPLNRVVVFCGVFLCAVPSVGFPAIIDKVIHPLYNDTFLIVHSTKKKRIATMS